MGNYEQQHILDYLLLAKSRGHHWVSYHGFSFPAKPVLLKTFESALQADIFCSKGKWKDSRSEEHHTQYVAIDNVLTEIRFEQTGKLSLNVAPAFIRHKLREMGVSFILPDRTNENCIRLALGDIASVFTPITLVPADHLESFHLISTLAFTGKNSNHANTPHAKQLLSSSDFTRAVQAFNEFSARSRSDPPNIDQTLQLVGKFKNTRLVYDQIGHIQHNTGLVLATSMGREGAQFLWKPEMLKEPVQMLQHHFVRHDSEQHAIISLDDRLRPATPGEGITSYGGAEFLLSANPNFIKAVERQLIVPPHNRREQLPIPEPKTARGI